MYKCTLKMSASSMGFNEQEPCQVWHHDAKAWLVYRVVHLYDGHECLVHLLQSSTDDHG